MVKIKQIFQALSLKKRREKAAKKREEKTAKTAYYLWEADGKPENNSSYYWHKASVRVAPNIFLKPFYKIEKFFENILSWLQRLAILEILGLLGNLTLLVGLITYFLGEEERRNLDVYQAWRVITGARGQAGSGGRIEALEFLNSSPGAPGRRRIPWFWVILDPESLAGVEAPNAYLVEIQLPNANLKSANFQDADLRNANLQNANLESANFQDTDLKNTNFQKANLRGTDLQRADLRSANLQNATLQRAKLQRADLAEADLQGADLVYGNLEGAGLLSTNFQKAYLIKAKLQGANLKDTALQGADLRGAWLQGSDLQRSEFQEADLRGAIYTDTNTRRGICEEFRLEFPCPTHFPDNFDPQEAGMILLYDSSKPSRQITPSISVPPPLIPNSPSEPSSLPPSPPPFLPRSVPTPSPTTPPR